MFSTNPSKTAFSHCCLALQRVGDSACGRRKSSETRESTAMSALVFLFLLIFDDCDSTTSFTNRGASGHTASPSLHAVFNNLFPSPTPGVDPLRMPVSGSKVSSLRTSAPARTTSLSPTSRCSVNLSRAESEAEPFPCPWPHHRRSSSHNARNCSSSHHSAPPATLFLSFFFFVLRFLFCEEEDAAA